MLWFFILFFISLNISLGGAKPPLLLSFKAGFFRPLSATLNDELIPLLNQTLQELQQQARELGFQASIQEIGKISGGAIAGVEVEVPFTPVFSLCLGWEYWKKSRQGSVEASGELAGTLYELSATTGLNLRLLPSQLSLRAGKRKETFRYYGGAGFSLILASVEYHSKLQFREAGEEVTEDFFKEKATARAFLPHLEAGVDYFWRRNLWLGINLRIPIGKINFFQVSESQDPAAIGERATFVDRQGREKPLAWEITGWQLGFVFRWLF